MLAGKRSQLREADIQRIHAFVMGGGRQQVKPTAYRDGQNVILDSATRSTHDNVDPAKKSRTYALNQPWQSLVGYDAKARILEVVFSKGKSVFNSIKTALLDLPLSIPRKCHETLP